MSKRILVLNGHPDPAPERLCAALAEAYAQGAAAAGHEIRRIDIGSLEFPFLGSAQEFATPPDLPAIQHAQDAVRWAEHLVFVYPLWLGSQPAKLKGFLEQIARGGFALSVNADTTRVKGLLGGRSAHLFVTMGMPGLVYRVVYGAFGVRALEVSVLQLCGVRPVRHNFFGMVEPSARRRQKWLAKMKKLGAGAA